MSNLSPCRIHIVGVSGSGKSTLSRQIATLCDLPRHELDNFFWRPDWSPAPNDEFLAQVGNVVAGERWVIDGRQQFDMDELIGARTQLLIWLDPPLPVVTWRVLKKTLRRALRRERLWAGNVEDWRLALGAFYRHTFRVHAALRRQYVDDIGTWYEHATRIRLGSAREQRALLRELEAGLHPPNSE